MNYKQCMWLFGLYQIVLAMMALIHLVTTSLSTLQTTTTLLSIATAAATIIVVVGVIVTEVLITKESAAATRIQMIEIQKHRHTDTRERRETHTHTHTHMEPAWVLNEWRITQDPLCLSGLPGPISVFWILFHSDVDGRIMVKYPDSLNQDLNRSQSEMPKNPWPKPYFDLWSRKP